jgi:hypothetical protein
MFRCPRNRVNFSPILIDGVDGIIAGHSSAEAAKLIGMIAVPCASTI